MSFEVLMAYITYYICGGVTWQPLAWRWILLAEHFDLQGKHKTKSLSLAINGRASVCLLIAPLEVQWDSFTVDGADNKPWPPARVTLNCSKRPVWNSTVISLFFPADCGWALPLNTVPSFPAERTMKTSGVQQDCWLKKGEFPPPPPYRKT